MTGIPPGAGLLESLRRMLASLVELGQVRLQLLSNEIEREKRRIFESLIRAAVALVLLGLGLALLCAMIVLAFDERHRVAVLAVLAVVFLAGGVLVLRSAHASMTARGGPLADSVDELARDRDAMQPPAPPAASKAAAPAPAPAPASTPDVPGSRSAEPGEDDG